MARHRVLIIAMPCREVVEVPGILDAFHLANQRTGRGGGSEPFYDVEIVSPVETVCHWQGLRLVADRSYRAVRGHVDTLIVTGIDDPDVARRDRRLTPWLARMAQRSERVVGLCTGTFVLAEAGLLNGRRATTHWAFCDELERRFPTIEVQPDPIYVRDGNVYTSAGATAGLDLILALIEEDLGRRLALAVAQWMVLFLKRPGGQAQFSTQLSAQMADREPFRDLQVWALQHPREDLSVDRLARRVHMSPRQFHRVFVREVGMTPGRFVDRARVEAARRLLEETSRSVSNVAARSGFGNPESMRVAFQRTLGVSPRVYRARFCTASSKARGTLSPLRLQRQQGGIR